MKIWLVLKWTVISCSIVCALAVMLFLGIIAYISRDTCDDTMPSPVVRNNRGDTAEGQVQVCTWIGTIVNYYITIQIHEATRIWPKKNLIDYDPAGPGREPVLRWVDDNTLRVDLGKVYWLSSRLDKVGNIRVIYNYEMVESPW
ncbi:MAG: hypothetical protein ACRECP_08640 [Methylocella sp.]